MRVCVCFFLPESITIIVFALRVHDLQRRCSNRLMERGSSRTGDVDVVRVIHLQFALTMQIEALRSTAQ